MGTRGPLPKQNTIRRNKRGVTGTAAVAHPTMPSTLPVEAKAEWRRVVPEVERMGLLTKMDRGLLIRYVTAWAEWVQLDADITKSGRLVNGPRGTLVRSPLVLLRRDAAAEVLALSVQLGLAPAARVRAGVKHEPPQSKEVAKVDPAVADFVAARRKRILEG